MTNGYTNEYDFVVYFNKKKVCELDPISYDMIHSIYYGINDSDEIHCWLNHYLQKGDILIRIKGIIKSFSIKSGSKNSVHAEHIYYFRNFLKEEGIPHDVIQAFNNYHFGIGENGERISSEEYKKTHESEIKKINDAFCKDSFIVSCIRRFVLKGTNCPYSVSGIIYGTPNDFLFISVYDIYQMVQRKKYLNSSGVHVGPFFIQPKSRNLNHNLLYEKCRDLVQVKWFSLFDDIMINYYEEEKSNHL